MHVTISNMKQQFSLFGKSRAASATIMSFFTSVVGDDLNQTGFDQAALHIVSPVEAGFILVFVDARQHHQGEV